MTTYYDLTSEEREKYRKEFKKTPVGKELYSNFYWTIIVLIIIAFAYGSLQGNIFDFENISSALTTMFNWTSLMVVIAALFVLIYYAYLNINFSCWLKNKYKIKRW